MFSNVQNWLRTVILLGLLTILILFFAEFFGGTSGLKIAFGLVMVLNMGAWWFSGNIVLVQASAKVVGPTEAPELYELLSHLAERAELPTPRLAIVDDPAPNALATGRSPANGVVAVTTGLLDIMSREELAGVMAHELAHIKNRDILVGSVVAVLAGAILLLVNLAQFCFMFLENLENLDNLANKGQGQRSNPVSAFLMTILAPVAAMVIQATISRSREYLADDQGADIAGCYLGLASALEKLGRHQLESQTASVSTAHMYIVNPLVSKTLRNLFATHPPLEERIARLRGEIL